MPDELIDIFDENLVYKSTALKSEAHKNGLWHKSIHCWIVNAQEPGYVLFQKRGRDKPVYPNALDISAAGHYQSGEKISDGVREIFEEVGIHVPFDSLIPLGIKIDVGLFRDHIVREFCEVFLLKNKLAPKDYSLNHDEVDGLVQISIDDGLALFSKERGEVQASGIEFNNETGRWDSIEISVTRASVIPRIDPYYYKIFIMAQRLLRGEKHLAI